MNPENKPVDTETTPPPSEYFNKEFISGLALGTATSLFSFFLLPFFKTKKTKREGMYYGVLFSFVFIFFLCASFTCYSYYVHKTLRVNRRLQLHDQKTVKIESFGHYVGARVLKLIPEKTIYEKNEKPNSPKYERGSYLTHVKTRKRKIV